MHKSMKACKSANKQPSIFFLVPYPIGKAPSQRFRVELFFPILQEAGISYKVQTFLNHRTWEIVYQGGPVWRKVLGIMCGFSRRLSIVLGEVWKYDFVFIHREAAPLGPPWIEWALAKLWRKRIIYDFDDAIWISNPISANRWVGWVKATWKVKWICRWSYKVVGGNDFLCDFARQFARTVIHIPTVVDTSKGHQAVKVHRAGHPVVGWTGSHSTLKYLDELVPVLQKLESELDFTFLVIADKDPKLPLRNYCFLSWSAEKENQDLLQMDIGVMPLTSDTWSEGKCGFKLIQYFAVGLPALASPVGVNSKLIENDKNGYLCESAEDWFLYLNLVLTNVPLRQRLGSTGRLKVEDQFSLQANSKIFLSLFNS